MYPKKRMAQTALQKALNARIQFDIGIDEAFCVYDYSERVGIEVRFVDIKSMEGMYIGNPHKTIFISSHRPPGRQRYTCAHELGHYYFGHGVHIDDMVEDYGINRTNPQEVMADLFAGYFLMPATTVRSGFARRKWQPKLCDETAFFLIANWLGVGYTTLINHMRFSLNMISAYQANKLLRIPPKAIKRALLGQKTDNNVVPVDYHWVGRPIDLFVGDFMLTPTNCMCKDDSRLVAIGRNHDRIIYTAMAPGLTRVYRSDLSWACFVRISRKEYSGRGMYRHLEEEENDA